MALLITLSARGIQLYRRIPRKSLWTHYATGGRFRKMSLKLSIPEFRRALTSCSLYLGIVTDDGSRLIG
jgi:hypothetical protein